MAGAACPAKPLATFLEAQARAIGRILYVFALAGALGRGRPFHGMREPLFLVPLYLVTLVPHIASMTVGWEGGWITGIAFAFVPFRFTMPLSRSDARPSCMRSRNGPSSQSENGKEKPLLR